MSEQQPRPGQATLAGGLIIGGSVFVILAAWERISSLHTLEVQEELERMLTDPMTSELGMSVDSLATVIRILCLVGAGSAAASVILGVQVFKRSASARIALTALTPLLFLGGMATAGFLAPMVLAGIALLWFQPTRDWYAGRPWVQRYEARRAARLGGPRPGTGPVDVPPPVAPTPPAATLPPPAQQSYALPAPGPVVCGPRPPVLALGCALTWLTSGLVLVGLIVLGASLPSQSDDLYAEVVRQQPQLMKESQFTERDIMIMLYVVLAGLALWAIAAMVLAGLAFVGQNWARIVLAISGAGATVLTVLFSIGAWPLVVLVALLAAGTWLLLRPEVGRWYAGR